MTFHINETNSQILCNVLQSAQSSHRDSSFCLIFHFTLFVLFLPPTGFCICKVFKIFKVTPLPPSGLYSNVTIWVRPSWPSHLKLDPHLTIPIPLSCFILPHRWVSVVGWTVFPQVHMLKVWPKHLRMWLGLETESSKKQLSYNEALRVDPNPIWLLSLLEEEEIN